MRGRVAADGSEAVLPLHVFDPSLAFPEIGSEARSFEIR
jgi:hypothetical protein